MCVFNLPDDVLGRVASSQKYSQSTTSAVNKPSTSSAEEKDDEDDSGPDVGKVESMRARSMDGVGQ